MSNNPSARPSRRLALGAALAALAAVQPSHADEPGRGMTARHEKDFLVYVIDHHYSALRVTELAAGTDRIRDEAVNNPREGTAPTPDFGPSPAKAAADEIRSLSRQANRTQREEIADAQRMLREWYGVQHTPTLDAEARQMIQRLENIPAGAQFDRAFLYTFSNHHFTILGPAAQCQVQADLEHHKLQRYCENIVITQKNQINAMREMLCKRFNDCGFAPGGRHHAPD